MIRRLLTAATALAVVVTACSRERSGPTAPPGFPAQVISDGAHAGNAHFFFLPPIVANPATTGTPDGTLSPRVQVCEWNIGAQRCGTIVASFTTTSGTGSEVVRYDAVAKHYIVNWKTNVCASGPCTLDPNTAYRLRVYVGLAELGFIDVTVVPNASALKNINTGETIGLVEGKTLPVKFRIEQGAVSVVAPGGSAPIGSSGGIVTTADGGAKIDFAAGALAASTPISVTPVANPAEGAETWTPVIDLGPDGTTFSAPVTLTLNYDPAALPQGLPAGDLVIYTLVDGAWEVVPGSVANEAEHTVSAPLSHFSQYRVGPRGAVTLIATSPTTFLVDGTATLSATACAFAGQTCLPARNARIAWIRTNGSVVSGPTSGVTNSSGVVTATFRGVAPGVTQVYAALEAYTTTSSIVSLTVVAPPNPPSIGVSPNTIGINVAVGSAVQTTVQVTNGGGGTLTGLEVSGFSDFHIGGAYPWITASLNTTTAPATITITAAPPVGTFPQNYRVRFTISATGANEFVFHSIFVNVTPAVAAAEVMAAEKSACLRQLSGTVYCWGETSYGATEAPSDIEFSTIEGGAFHYCGIRTSQALACWGYNSDLRATPPAGTFRELATGGEHNCALRTDNTAACWGFLNDGRGSPPAGQYAHITVGQYHGCGIRPDETLVCWGNNDYGQATPPAGTFRQVEGARFFTCGIRTDLTVACWGAVPTPPSGAFISLGHALVGHMCGVRIDHTLACWGENQFGQSSPPAGQFTMVSEGGLFSCGLRVEGTPACWGSNSTGALDIPAEAPRWSQAAPMITPRWGAVTVVAEGKVYTIGGNASPQEPYPGGPTVGTVEAYDPTTNTWTSLAPMPVALEHMMGAYVGGRIYVFGGWMCNLCGDNRMWSYDVAGNTWTQGPQPPIFLNGGIAGVINDKIYMTTGTCCGSPGNGFLMYDPATQAYTMLPFSPWAHAFAAGGGVIDGKFYVAGGEGNGGVLDVYDPATNSWTMRASMPANHQHGAGVVVNGKLWTLGGEVDGPGSWTNVNVYDPVTNSWSVATQLPVGRNLNGAAFINGRIYVIGGNAGSPVPPGAPIGRVDRYVP